MTRTAPAAPLYRVTDLRTGRAIVCTIEEAARATDLDADDIAWAIEEAGEATTDTHTVEAVDPTDPIPGAPADEAPAHAIGARVLVTRLNGSPRRFRVLGIAYDPGMRFRYLLSSIGWCHGSWIDA